MNINTYAIAGTTAIIYKYDYSNSLIFTSDGDYASGVTEVGIKVGTTNYDLNTLEKLSLNNCVFALVTGLTPSTTYQASLYYIKNSSEQTVNSISIKTYDKGTCTIKLVNTATLSGLENYTALSKDFKAAKDICEMMVANEFTVIILWNATEDLEGSRAAWSGVGNVGYLLLGALGDSLDRNTYIHEMAHSCFEGHFGDGINNSPYSRLLDGVEGLSKLTEFIYDLSGAYHFCLANHSHPFNCVGATYSYIEDCFVMAAVNLVLKSFKDNEVS